VKITPKFHYEPYKRKNVNGSRHYICKEYILPSVTTILSKTKDMTALDEWAARIGKDNAEDIKNQAAARGSKMHKHIEDYITEGKEVVEDANEIHTSMALLVLEKIKPHLKEIWGSEINLYYPGQYAGTTDIAGVWDGKPAIVDFKQTNKPKKEEWIEDYKLQLVSYAEAHNKLFGTEIQSGVIVMCSQFLDYQEFYISETVYSYYKKQWWERVDEYYNLKAFQDAQDSCIKGTSLD
jgi:genome maintenance exonuclease 1